MELKLLTENALFVAIFVIGFLPVIAVVLRRAGKSIRIGVLIGSACQADIFYWILAFASMTKSTKYFL